MIVHPAENGLDPDRTKGPQAFGILTNLDHQLAGWGENKGSGVFPDLLISSKQASKKRNQKSGCFPGPGLSLDSDILPGQSQGNGFFLNRCQILKNLHFQYPSTPLRENAVR